MIIDAMDVLYGGNVDGFVLVSDSDYTRLAVRLRESGRFSARNGRTPVLQWETPSVEEAHKPEVPIGIGTSGEPPEEHSHCNTGV